MDGNWKFSSMVAFIIFIVNTNIAICDSTCSEKKSEELLNFYDTAVCDIDKDVWLDKCLDFPCYSGFTGCPNAQGNACNKLLEKTYTETIKQAKSIKYEDYDDYNNAEGSEEKRLKESQESWVKYRESHCKVNVDFSGSGSRMKYNYCFLEQTKNRIKELRKYYAPRAEGDIF